ncbi:flavoprotein [Anaeromicrobium sediminis]|uniref:Flavoprotein domain-containing protein n=1 Tax=Anaeromicrobium sediminis TaxID=1478221 RepID=A0A267MJI1_9FIRM|nr:flavoprotein [Anaeromicrobium sediminis]PAB59729.1 hypothetical protein CCE28_09185 [Anaeromicrobium sediminis]
MSNKELIMKVLGDITTRINSQSIEPRKNLKVEKEKILVLFTGSNFQINKALDGLKKLKENDYSLTLCFSKNGGEILDIQGISDLLRVDKLYLEEDKNNYLEIIKSSDMVIVPVLTQNTLAKVAVGIQDSFISGLLWQLLWSGKKVFVNPNSALDKNNMPCENKKMLKLINNHVERLREFGAKIINDYNYMSYMNKEPEKLRYDNSKEGKNERVGFKKVVTEKDVLNLVGTSNELVIDKRTIITPLAKDVAKEKEVKILRK